MWYENRKSVLLWLVLFFPLGLYGMHKSSKFERKHVRLAVLILFLLAGAKLLISPPPEAQRTKPEPQQAKSVLPELPKRKIDPAIENRFTGADHALYCQYAQETGYIYQESARIFGPGNTGEEATAWRKERVDRLTERYYPREPSKPLNVAGWMGDTDRRCYLKD